MLMASFLGNLNLGLKNFLFNQKSKQITRLFLDVIGTKIAEVLLVMLEVI